MHNDEHDSTHNDDERSASTPHSLQASRPTRRFLIDFTGGGTYQLSLQDPMAAPLPIATGQDPRPLFQRAVDSADAGDEILIAPLVALVHVCSLPTGLLRILAENNADPFEAVGALFRVPCAMVGRRRKRAPRAGGKSGHKTAHKTAHKAGHKTGDKTGPKPGRRSGRGRDGASGG